MENFRDFEIGPDPFGRTWRAMFRYQQNGISIRHSDSVDVGYTLECGSERLSKVVVLNHAELRSFAAKTGRTMSDTWCSRLGGLKLKRTIENGDDLDKEFLLVTPQELGEFDTVIRKWEAEYLASHAA